MTDSGDPPELDRPSDAGRGAEALSRTAPVVVAGGLAADDPADRWLVWLRWVAVAGMGATIFTADQLVDGLGIRGMFAVLLAIGGTNLGWMALLAREGGRAARTTTAHERPSGRRFVEAQLALDVALLTLMLWFAGGVSNPFASFLVFQIALSGLLSTPRATLGVTGLAIVATVILCFAPPLPPLPPRETLVAIVVALTSMAALLGAFFAVYARRLDRLRAESSRNEKLAVLGRLVGSMSHELNTPLATILLSIKDLERYGGEMSEEERGQLVSAIAREAERANAIIGLVRGHVGPDQVVERVELTQFVGDLAREELDRLGFAGERRFELGEPVHALVMKRALVQVLVNILRNATEVSVLGRTRRITVAVERVDGRAEIRIEDRGPGFEPEILARLGEPFQTTKRGGMGLGLYVSGMLAKQMGSVLRVQSVKGGGARVSVSIELDSS
ncbi:MAG: ATP-binding protein [Polyangiaceae bacterium]